MPGVTTSLSSFLCGTPPRPNGGALRVVMDSRAVFARETPWSDVFDGPVADAGGALDLARSFDPPDEPTVLRVFVVGEGDRLLRVDGLSGDWLLDAGYAPRPVHLGLARWPWARITDGGGGEGASPAEMWVGARPWLDAWEMCPEASWLADFASIAGVPTATQRAMIRAVGEALTLHAVGFHRRCRQLLATAAAVADAREPAPGEFDRDFDDFEAEVDREAREYDHRYAARGVSRCARLLLMRPGAWMPRGPWPSAYAGVMRPLVRRSRPSHFAGHADELRAVREAVPPLAVLRGLADQGVGEGRETAHVPPLGDRPLPGAP